MGTNKGLNSAQARTNVQAYIRRLLGSNRQTSGIGSADGMKTSLPKGNGTGGIGGTPHSLPRQLEATAYTKTTNTASKSSGSGFGNAWLISPIASTVKSILDLFGGGSSTQQTTRYRTTSRQTFNVVESISPETGSGTQQINESAASITGVVRNSTASAGSASGSPISTSGASAASTSRTLLRADGRHELVSALRRSLSESRGISDVLNEFQDGL